MRPFHYTFSAMHTRMDIVTYGIAEERFQTLIKNIEAEVQRIEHLISRFIVNSPVYNINHTQEKRIQNIPPELFDLLLRCQQYNLKTEGYFDISYHSSKELNDINKNNEEKRVIYLNNKEKQSIDFARQPFLDLGGIGKGYTLEKIKPILKIHEVKNILISFGESSILAAGRHPYGDCWKIGVPHPEKKEILHEWLLFDECLSTSRSASGHIINPNTGKEVISRKLVTVKSPNAEEAEAISTALIAAEKNEIENIKNNFSSAEIVIFEY